MFSVESHFELQVWEKSGRCKRPVGVEPIQPKVHQDIRETPKEGHDVGAFQLKRLWEFLG
jgi:hypothetical protein